MRRRGCAQRCRAAVALAILALAVGQVVQGKKLLDVNFNVRFLGSHNTSDDGRAGLAGLAGLQGKLAALKGSSNGPTPCFPTLTGGSLTKPVKSCPEGFTATNFGSLACVRKAVTEAQACSRATTCPANTTDMKEEAYCLPPEMRSCMVGMLVVFRVHATLPFQLLPALGGAIKAAAMAPPSLVMSKGNATLPRLSLKVPALNPADVKPWADALKQAQVLANVTQDAAEKIRAKDYNISFADGWNLIKDALLDMNSTEFMNTMPQINEWISAKLENLTNVNEITAQIGADFPTCLRKCCKSDTAQQSSFTLPKQACPSGTSLHPFLELCVSGSFADCPASMSRCMLPAVAVPVCVGGTNTPAEACNLPDLAVQSNLRKVKMCT